MVDPQPIRRSAVNRARTSDAIHDPRTRRMNQAGLSARDLDPTSLALAPNGQVTIKLKPGTQLVKTPQGLAFTQAQAGGTDVSEVVLKQADPVADLPDLVGSPTANETAIHAVLKQLIENLRLADIVDSDDEGV